VTAAPDTVPPDLPTDADTTVSELRERVRRFVEDRDWGRFHTPKNLAMSIAIEAAELMELVQWLDADQAAARTAADGIDRAAFEEELADVCCYVLSLANATAVDLSAAIARKIAKNARKYPAAEFRGRFE
jgi:dCTP diphosphatase